MDVHGAVAEQYADFVRYAGDSPSLAGWAEAVCEDREVLTWLESLPPGKQQPNLVFAAARWHGVAAPGPYEGLRSALLEDDGPIRDTILTRSTQTNEVGRLATLVPAFGAVAERYDGAALSLLEVGASAGLCLYPDRWSYRWRRPGGDVTAGPAVPEGSPRELPCEVSGPAPLPTRLPAVARRTGIDLNPLDVTDPDTVAWLRVLVWPEHHDRRARLDEAVRVAAAEPARLVRGDLLMDLPGLVAEAATAGPVLVFHSAVIAYLSEPDRREFHATMTGLVADGACAWVSNEAARVLPGVSATAPGRPADRSTFVLGVDGRAVARTHPHGRMLDWYDG